MIELYSSKDVAEILGLPVSRLRYWAQVGFVNPSRRKDGRRYYTFRDVIQVRAARDLIDAGLSVQKARKNLEALRALLPEVTEPASRLHISSDGETVLARDDTDALFEPLTGQLVMDFTVESLSNHVADILALPTSMAFAEIPDVTPLAVPPADTAPVAPASPLSPGSAPGPTARARAEERKVGDRAIDEYALGRVVYNDQLMCAQPDQDMESGQESEPVADEPPAAPEPAHPETGYQLFLRGHEAEDRDDLSTAGEYYLRAIESQPSLASAHTNLGNIMYRLGDIPGARRAYEIALELEPAQPEARYNLGNVLEDMGETELAIAELRRVCWTHPRFADAHYNLGLMLARVGGVSQARSHLRQYLEIDDSSEWATRAREFLLALG